MFKSVISKILIIAGGICIVVAICYEAFNYPWSTLNNEHINELELPDPSPPDFDYIDYTEEPDSSGETGETPTYDDTPVLPGEEASADTAADSAAGSANSAASYVLLGVVKIPKINVSENLFEGTEKQMNYGIGHLSGSAMPGKAGNSVIAAHRVTSFGMQPFRYLDKMGSGDVITVRFNDVTYTYEVFDVFIVTKYDVWILEPMDSETHVLTLVTCDPVISVGSRVNRLIVRARLTLVDGLEPEPLQEDDPQPVSAPPQEDSPDLESPPPQEEGSQPEPAQEDGPEPVSAPPLENSPDESPPSG